MRITTLTVTVCMILLAEFLEVTLSADAANASVIFRRTCSQLWMTALEKAAHEHSLKARKNLAQND